MKTYLRHKIVNVIDVKGLVALEYLDFEGRYKEYVEQHDFWELCYVEEGKISFRSDTAERKRAKPYTCIRICIPRTALK